MTSPRHADTLSGMRAAMTIRSRAIVWLLAFGLALGSAVADTGNHIGSPQVPVQPSATNNGSGLDPMGQTILELAIVRSLVLTHVPVGKCPLTC